MDDEQINDLSKDLLSDIRSIQRENELEKVGADKFYGSTMTPDELKELVKKVSEEAIKIIN